MAFNKDNKYSFSSNPTYYITDSNTKEYTNDCVRMGANNKYPSIAINRSEIIVFRYYNEYNDKEELTINDIIDMRSEICELKYKINKLEQKFNT